MRRLVLVLALLSACLVSASPFKYHEKVPFRVNTVGPYYNPAETYKFYSLPFCAPSGGDDDGDADLGQAIKGERTKASLYQLKFKVDMIDQEVCKKKLSVAQVDRFISAIHSDYMWEHFVDGLSLRYFVGVTRSALEPHKDHSLQGDSVYLFTHHDFNIQYSWDHSSKQGHVLAVNVTAEKHPPTQLHRGRAVNVPLAFTYSVRWQEVRNVAFADRNAYHMRGMIGQSGQADIHWLSIVNSIVLVMLLTAFLAWILMRTLKSDFARYLDTDAEDQLAAGDENADDSGWKQIHGDVFRPPQRLMLFCACVGVGTQMLVLVVSLLVLAVLGSFYPGQRGAIYSAAVLIYCFTAGIAGYIACRLYVQLGGTKWATLCVMCASLFALPFFGVFAVCNTVADTYGTTTALKFGKIMTIFALWALVTFPLTVLGASRGRRVAGKLDVPCKTLRAKREVPPVPWFRGTAVSMVISGFLPFTAIYIELHYLFTSVWGLRLYTMWELLAVAFTLLLIVTAFIVVALIYFQLGAEDWRWWWSSYLMGGSAGLFVFAYSYYFFFWRSQMQGFLQTVFFFGYAGMISYASFLMLGAVGFWSSFKFTKHIYRAIKSD